MKIKFALLLSLITLIGYSQESPAPSPMIVVKVLVGETISIENHTIKFINVIEDSRCPKDATCIWAGRAKILVEISSENKETIQKELIFGKANQGESNDLELFNTNNKKVKAYQLNPYPVSNIPNDNSDYVLLMKVEN